MLSTNAVIPGLEGKEDRNLERKEMEQGKCKSDWKHVEANAAISTGRDGVRMDTLQEQMECSQSEKCTNISSRTLPSQAENFPTDISLKLTMVRQKSGCPDPKLQRQLRGRLRLLENDSREVMAVFSELSARLVSIHSDQDLIVVTFKTFEEIWKFLTYHSLGFINHCMENLFLDQSFWLYCQENEETGIEVCINEKSLNLMYRSLLVQEGAFFVLCPDNLIRKIMATDNEINTYFETGAFTEDVMGGSSDGDMTVLSNASPEPLIPFHQWFLKGYSNPIDFTYKTESKSIGNVAMGSCLAVIKYESIVLEEMSFQEGDKIEILGYFIECMEWFLGRHAFTGQIGFVKTSHVKLDLSRNKLQDLDFLEEEELSFFSKEKNLEEVIHLLKKISITEVCSVYRIDQLEEPEFQKAHEYEIPCSHSSTGSTSKNGKIEEFLKNFKNLAATQAEEPTTEGKDSASSPNTEIFSSPEGPCFHIGQDDVQAPDIFESLLLFLNRKEYERNFKNLYDFSYSFINSMFYGFSEEELVSFFRLAREAAKQAGMSWALARICFLLGRLSVKKLKFSQARVYFEEALRAVAGGFSDLYFVIALYTNLTVIYLTQKNKEKCAHVFDKATSLLMGIPNYVCSADLESDILKYALKRTILSQNKHAEARACFLLAKHYSAHKQHEEALPFLERFQLLLNDLGLQNNLSNNCYFKLVESYNEKCLPHIVLSCIKVTSSLSSGSLMDSLKRIDLVIKNAPKLCGLRKLRQILPSQIAPYLIQALSSVFTNEQQGLRSTIYLSLVKLYSHHKWYGKAIVYMMKALDSDACAKPEETINYLVLLAWLYILYRQYDVALDILNAVVDSSWNNPQQLGIAYNMLAIALKRINNKKEAAESYYKALRLSEETDMTHNQAIALANFGSLCLHAAASKLAEHYYIRAVKLFSKLPSMDCGQDFIQVLLQLGCYYVGGTQKEKGRLYYEWAFLVAMETNHLESQLQAVNRLCQFYSTVVPSEAQCVIYNEYQLSLARKMSNKVLEGQILETISQLYLSLGTERAYRSALEYTKRSLGIFIDLQKKEKEAYAWLRAGKIYYVLRQNELVDLYIQVAQDAALYTGDPNLGMELFEAAGDIFFNGTWEKEKAVTFYRDRALPLAVQTRNKNTELRLCNKLVELLVNLKAYEESLEYAKASLMLSVNLGNQLNERIAYHRLAAIHHHLGHCELAEHFYLKALSLCSSPLEFEEETLYYVKVYLILGDIIFYDLKDPFDAAGYYHLALAAAMDLGNKKAQLKIYTRLAIIYHNFLVDREKSLFFYQKARTFATELNVRRINLAPDQCYKSS
ncbi:PREDICTED: SH3 domain and tetratricopeptide repeat-containing protein 1 [Cariama cristata]|uniref:SH3 domain and tetratricopeptide repeat-containing protein 1 n=1 Tax=Cariama cristata TaxID=54380 RepID=UPI000520E05B|nr:PREDICTED: SH3 domain and tetratricopeptide repeat-containing protein 1 [Cariama cristata]